MKGRVGERKASSRGFLNLRGDLKIFFEGRHTFGEAAKIEVWTWDS